MGEIADHLTEQGMDELATHDSGMCDGPCQYCEDEEEEEKQEEGGERATAE